MLFRERICEVFRHCVVDFIESIFRVAKSLMVICCLALVYRSVTCVARGFSVSFDLSSPGMALIKIRFICSFLSFSACNLAACVAVYPSKRAYSNLSSARPLREVVMLQLLEDFALGRPVVLLFVNSPGNFWGFRFLGHIVAVLS